MSKPDSQGLTHHVISAFPMTNSDLKNEDMLKYVFLFRAQLSHEKRDLGLPLTVYILIKTGLI